MLSVVLICMSMPAMYAYIKLGINCGDQPQDDRVKDRRSAIPGAAPVADQ